VHVHIARNREGDTLHTLWEEIQPACPYCYSWKEIHPARPYMTAAGVEKSSKCQNPEKRLAKHHHFQRCSNVLSGHSN